MHHKDQLKIKSITDNLRLATLHVKVSHVFQLKIKQLNSKKKINVRTDTCITYIYIYLSTSLFSRILWSLPF